MQLLAEEFEKDPEWSKERLFELSQLTGLTEAQIYKWGWDQRKKVNDPTMPAVEHLQAENVQPKKREAKQKDKETNAKNENIIED